MSEPSEGGRNSGRYGLEFGFRLGGLGNIDARLVVQTLIDLTSAPRYERHGGARKHRVRSHDQKKRPIAAGQIEEPAVQRIANRTAQRDAQKKQRRKDAPARRRNGLDEQRKRIHGRQRPGG
jgi:hypothetical protein